MDVVIEMTDEERKLTEKYAEKHSSTLEELFKRALFERIGAEKAKGRAINGKIQVAQE
jgi:hypothetical protein